MSITYLTGDATRPVSSPAVITHVCNDVGKWGAGFVLALSDRWAAPEAQYRQWFEKRTDGGLGVVQWSYVEHNIWVANMVAQHGTYKRGQAPPIRYGALEQTLGIVANGTIGIHGSVHMPRIGCGLAGGTWKRVEVIIDRTLVQAGIDVYVYDLPKSDP